LPLSPPTHQAAAAAKLGALKELLAPGANVSIGGLPVRAGSNRRQRQQRQQRQQH
jgi:hypothetical protein